ncbi:unnamed protein product [Rhizoctonia solani]|uniref:Uncharacterized protein n=1 Tax=Rhizoctonia solani TaxID=456999 RepID=A0A8H3CRA4_9AGAM|nr:unnamed protein product [Rhizoctonia solani]
MGTLPWVTRPVPLSPIDAFRGYKIGLLSPRSYQVSHPFSFTFFTTHSRLAMLFSTILLTLSVTLAFASPLDSRAAPDNTVRINSASSYCMIMPRKAHTNIGDSESTGQMQSYCSASGKTDPSQGNLPNDFWTKVTYKKGRNNGDWVQLTGRIRKGSTSQLNDNDGGGQYDSSGGAGGAGNPRGSKCAGYNHYVEIVEPNVSRACIRCCQDTRDCRLDRDTAGCPAVIPGEY